MTIFEFSDFRTYLRAYLRQLPKQGRGELTRIANQLRINTTLLSQIMSGGREFNLEQALELSHYLAHSELETEFFSLFVQIERAGTTLLKNHLKKKLDTLREEALNLSKRVAHEKKLTAQQRSRFYSSWLYSAIHLFTSTRKGGVSVDEIAQRFQIDRPRALEALQFLLQTGIVTEISGRYRMGVQSTYLERAAPELLKHHSNWRVRAIHKSENLAESELMFTGQASLSKKDFATLRELLTELIKKTAESAKKSEAEDVACLNIDWFWI